MSDIPSEADETGRTRVVLVTGLSGAGRTTALHALEDLGYEAVDNVPISLVPRLLRQGSDGETVPRALAVSVDIRTRGFAVDAMSALEHRLAKRGGTDLFVLFLDCSDEVLTRRFTETRRRHPLAQDRPVADGIRQERDLIGKLRDSADLVLDTSELTQGDFRAFVAKFFTLEEDRRSPTLSICSFSYRRGLPREADLVFDVRFLANPHYEPELRPKTGQDGDVAAFIAADPAFSPFFNQLGELLISLLPRYKHEGKSYLTIAIGCTGGRHRSVFVSERLSRFLMDEGFPVHLRHRDVQA